MPTIELDRYVDFSMRLAELCCRWMITAEWLDRSGEHAQASVYLRAIHDTAAAFPEVEVGIAEFRKALT